MNDTRARPGKLNYASGSATYNIATESLLSIAGGKAALISYKGRDRRPPSPTWQAGRWTSPSSN
ncbi:hypothetical protein [Xylophilus sp.]|uniref:hypothetical protein n=1 Tax=Xylophilus sp. TaxID=2653893 RepID=UPI002D7F8A9D|nr:hypothetical protein [Xylophilus sp.]